MKLLVDIEEAAEMVGVKRTTMYRLLADGAVESVKIGRSRRVPVEALKEYVARLRAEAREAEAVEVGRR
jgi:excisionase family DNA binding protein